MPATHTLLRDTYAAFNRRDIPAALAAMTEDVQWPRASEGGTVRGKDAIRAYWTRQWAELNPHVEPTAILPQPDGTALVRVRQLVRALDGTLLSDSEVQHRFAFHNGRIASMQLVPANPATSLDPSAAFHRP